MKQQEQKKNNPEFEALLERISDAIENRSPINLTREDALVLRRTFEANGISFEKVNEHEVKDSLLAPKMRLRMGHDKDARGRFTEPIDVEIYDRSILAVDKWKTLEKSDTRVEVAIAFDEPNKPIVDKSYAAMETLGVEGLRNLVTYCFEIYHETDKKVRRTRLGGHPGTIGRGLMSNAMEFIAAAAYADDSYLLQRINFRINQELRRSLAENFPKEKEVVNGNFANFPRPKFAANYYPPFIPSVLRFLASEELHNDN